MALLILLALIAVPIFEISVFIQVSDEIGLFSTLAATVLTAVIGTILVRTQGLTTVRKLQKSLEEGGIPLRPAFDGACQLFAGGLLLTPGFITDGVGLLLFLPPIRTLLLAWVMTRAGDKIVVSNIDKGYAQKRNGEPTRTAYDVEGEYTDVTPSDTPPLPPTSNPQDQ